LVKEEADSVSARCGPEMMPAGFRRFCIHVRESGILLMRRSENLEICAELKRVQVFR